MSFQAYVFDIAARYRPAVHKSSGGAGECLIFGTNRRAAPLDAALINGMAAHAVDFDDVSNSLGGHPSVLAAKLSAPP